MDKIMSKRILIIDDDPMILAILKDLLQDNGYTVQTGKASAAIDIALNNPPDLLLLDMMMPDISGVQVAQKLRSDPRTSYIPIVAISAAARVAEMGRQADVDAILKKPFDFKQVLETIERFIGDA